MSISKRSRTSDREQKTNRAPQSACLHVGEHLQSPSEVFYTNLPVHDIIRMCCHSTYSKCLRPLIAPAKLQSTAGVVILSRRTLPIALPYGDEPRCPEDVDAASNNEAVQSGHSQRDRRQRSGKRGSCTIRANITGQIGCSTTPNASRIRTSPICISCSRSRSYTMAPGSGSFR